MTPKQKVFSVLTVLFLAALPLAAQKVKLSAATNPSAGQPGLNSVSLTGSGFPSGTIVPASVTVTLTPSGGSPVTTPASSVTKIVGSTEVVGFLIPASIAISTPTAYAVSIAGTTTGGVAFSSTNTAALTVDPSAAISAISPGTGAPGQTVTVTITAQYTNFGTGATQASFGPGISVNGAAAGGFGNVTVTSATTATASLVIAPNAQPGAQTVTVQTGQQSASLAGGFTIQSITFPQVTLTNPAPLTIFNASGNPITVTGTVDNSQDTVVVNGVQASVSNGSFTAQGIQLREGQNVITASATNTYGNIGTASETVTLNTTPPQLGILAPSDGAVVNTSTVTVAGNVNEQVPGTIGDKQVAVMVNGVVATVSNRTFSATNVPLVQGLNVVTATATDPAGNKSQVQIHVTYMGTIPVQKIVRISGESQSGQIGSALANPLVVEAVDANGAAIPNQALTFNVVKSDGVLTSTNQQGQKVTVTTDQNGMASVQFQLGTRVGVGNNQVAVTANGFVGELLFCETATVGPASQILVEMGDHQTGVTGQALPSPFAVTVFDSGGNPVPYVSIVFTVQQGGGTLNGNSTLTVSTDVNGMASALLTLGQQEGINNNVVSATFQGNTGAAASFVASGQTSGPASVTSISGLVEDDSSTAVPGATVTLEGTNLSVLSDANGNFSISPAPVGTFILQVNGHTSTRTDATFPTLTYEITTVAGLNNTLGMPVCLPPLDPTSVQNYDPTATQPITLQMTGVPGYLFTVAPNSVFNPDGTPYTGPLSLSQVHADRVPMAPPHGSLPLLAGTLQPPGLHFNPPVQTQFPNTSGLAPGTVLDIYSYDHDQMDWVSQGPARVSADGSVIVSDPGFGISKSGWHFPPPPPPPPKCASSCTSTNPCVTGQCVNGACQYTPANDGGACGDGTSDEECGSDGKCQSGSCVFDSTSSDGEECTPTDKCVEDAKCQSGQCVGKPVDTESVVDDNTLSAQVNFPPTLLDGISQFITTWTGASIEFTAFNVAVKGTAKNCCDPNNGPQTLGFKEATATVQVGASVQDVTLWGTRSFEIKKDLGFAEVDVLFDFGVKFGADITFNGEAGYRSDACKSDDTCLFGQADASFEPSLYLKAQLITCVETFTSSTCLGGSAVGGVKAAISIGVRYNKPDCNAGPQGFLSVGQGKLFVTVEVDIPAKIQFSDEYAPPWAAGITCTFNGSLSCGAASP